MSTNSVFLSSGDRDLGVAFKVHPGSQASLEWKQRTPLSSRVATSISWSPLSGLKEVKPPVEYETGLGIALYSLQERKGLISQ